jgi:Tfp pilus assembly protein PilP
MKAWSNTVSILALGWLATGCGQGPTAPEAANRLAAAPPSTASTTSAPKPAVATVLPRVPEAGPPLAPLNYEAKGRRDPFAPVQVVTQKGLDMGAARLVGIIQGDRLLALVETSDGLGYILKPGDVLGNGRVTDVTASSVTFGVIGRAAQRETNVTLRLAKS